MLPPNSEKEPATLIAESKAPSLRVLAGPGTGKTYSLKMRVARLLQDGVDPKSILVTTFARTAAMDLQNELESMEVEGAKQVDCTTVHALCRRILGRNNVLEVTGRNPRPLMNFEKKFMLQDLKLVLSWSIKDLEDQLLAFADGWARNWGEVPSSPDDPRDKDFEKHLKKWLTVHEAMLIEELVPEAHGFLRDNPASPERKSYTHVLVDEYQDLNQAEQEFIALVSKLSNIAVIGDENQSIYSFKHAHPKGITNFDENYIDTEDHILSDCRRCPSNIVQMTNELISHNELRIDRDLVADPLMESADVSIVQWENAQKEADGMAQYIKRSIQQFNFDPGKILVLSPRRTIGHGVRKSLSDVGIEAHSFFSEDALHGDPKDKSKCQAQESYTLLTLIADPNDYVALRCWCGFGSSNLRATAWKRILVLCAQENRSLPDVLEDIRTGKLNLKHGSWIAKRLNELRDRLAGLSSLEGEDLFDALFPAGVSEFEQIRDSMAEGIEPEESASSILERLRTKITQPELPTDVEYVRIMSLHKSKGLTADLVIVLGCVEGLIPSRSKAKGQQKKLQDLEEQRRLFYVAITRVRKQLILSSVNRVPRKEAYSMGIKVANASYYVTTVTSQFIKELGPNRPDPISGSEFLET